MLLVISYSKKLRESLNSYYKNLHVYIEHVYISRKILITKKKTVVNDNND